MEYPSLDKEIIDIKSLFYIFFKEKVLIFSITLLFSFFSVFYALNISNIYNSESKLISTSELESAKKNVDYGNLGLGGFVDLVGGGSPIMDPRSKLAKELLTSKEFISEFVTKRNILIPLMAGESWDKEKNKININQNIYDEKEMIWKRKATHLLESKPSRNEIFEKFSSSFQFRKNKDGIIYLTLSSLSPTTSENWLKWIIEDVNEDIRKKEILSSQQRIDFLLKELQSESVSSTRDVISAVLAAEYSQLMLANTQKDFSLTVIDPPSLASSRTGTPRSVICILITTFGFFFSILIVILKNYLKFFK